MCGIVGVISRGNSNLSGELSRELLKKLLLDSQTRGKDSSGIARVTGDEIRVFKQEIPASELVRSRQYARLVNGRAPDFVAMAHTRMETNGSFQRAFNNQPVMKSGVIAIHNGIIVNDGEIWSSHRELHRDYEVDTEALCALVGSKLGEQAPVAAFVSAAKELGGSYSVGLLFEGFDGLLLATNTGSLYTLAAPSLGLFCFASEERFLVSATDELLAKRASDVRIEQLRPRTGTWLAFADGTSTPFTLDAVPEIAPAASVKRRRLDLVGSETDLRPLPPTPNAGNRREIERLVTTEYARVR
jgi:glucosamine--fructose-6-phosphate aminotransferase (isomerizing)